MKKLFLPILAVLLFTGCAKESPEGSLLGRGQEYSVEALSFRTELDTDTNNPNNVSIDDSEYDAHMYIFCGNHTREGIPSFEEQYSGMIDDYVRMDGYAKGWTVNHSLEEKVVTIDGHEAEAMSLTVEMYRPERGRSWYFVEQAYLFAGGKCYMLQYIYDTMRDDLKYTYDPKRDNADINEIKQRALTMYDHITVNA